MAIRWIPPLHAGLGQGLRPAPGAQPGLYAEGRRHPGAGLHRSRACGQRTIGHGPQHLGCGIAEIDRIYNTTDLTQPAATYGFIAWRGQADDGDRAALVGLGHGVCRCWGRHRRHAENALQLIAIFVDERVGLVERQDVVFLRLDRFQPLQFRMALRLGAVC